MNRMFDPEEIRKAIGILKPDNELFEVRILSGYRTLSGYFRDADALITELCKLDARFLSRATVYFTLQEVHPGCEARLQWERFLDSKFEKFPTTSNNDILSYEFLPVDLDPVRPSEISSTIEELKAARDLAHEVMDYMVACGWNRYVYAFSGNGYHVLFRTETPVSNSKVIEDRLSSLDQLFSNDRVKVDTTLSNPARIIKLYGTYARKGRSTVDRPHRLSRILEVVD